VSRETKEKPGTKKEREMMVVNASRNEGVWDIERRCEGVN